VLIGKGQGAYTALNLSDAEDYQKVKKAILKPYELRPEEG
jgi:hypothetical protein